MYSSTEDLPREIREQLPVKAQELYRAAFNRVCEKEAAADPKLDESVTADAHDAAMLAVQAEFSQDEEGRWEAAPVGERMEDRQSDQHSTARRKEDDESV